MCPNSGCSRVNPDTTQVLAERETNLKKARRVATTITSTSVGERQSGNTNSDGKIARTPDGQRRGRYAQSLGDKVNMAEPAVADQDSLCAHEVDLWVLDCVCGGTSKPSHLQINFSIGHFCGRYSSHLAQRSRGVSHGILGSKGVLLQGPSRS